MKTPFPHQQEAANYLQARRDGFLWMSMRTGKSFSCLFGDNIHLYDWDSIPMLILAPITPLLGWRGELLDIGVPPEKICFAVGMSAEKRKNLLRSPRYDFFLVNYDVMADLDVINIRRGIPFLRDFQRIVFDESYCISTTCPKLQYWKPEERYKVSTRTQYAMDSGQTKPYYQKRAALSGLPNPESPLNFAPQYFAVDGHYMGFSSFEEYMDCNWVYNKWKREWKMMHPYHEVRIMDYVQQNSYMCTMEQANPNTGGLLFQIWDIPITPEQELLYRWLDGATQYHKKDEDPMVDEPHMLLPVVKFTFGILIACGVHPITKNRLPSNKGKYLVQWYKDHKLPAIVLSYSVDALLNLSEDFTEAGISHVVVYGDTPKEDRGEAKRKFQEGEVEFFLGQSATVMMGYDLSRSDYIFYISNDCSNNVRSQANMRGLRPDKNTPVSIIDLCAEGTRERDLVPLLGEKNDVSRKFIEQENVPFLT